MCTLVIFLEGFGVSVQPELIGSHYPIYSPMVVALFAKPGTPDLLETATLPLRYIKDHSVSIELFAY